MRNRTATVLATAVSLGSLWACSNGLNSFVPLPQGNSVDDPVAEPVDAGAFVDPGVTPSFGPTVHANVAPAPISGGTLLVLNDGVTAVASDPDRDAVYVVDIPSQSVRQTIALQTGDEPGRLVEDGAGRVHVALRSGAALVTIDPLQGSILARRAACPAPRGVAWDSTQDAVLVACATGELVSLPAAGGAATSNQFVQRDLRDIVDDNGALSVSFFRSAEVGRLDNSARILRVDEMPNMTTAIPQVAWRMVAGPDHSVVTVHQEHSTLPISTVTPGGYGVGPSQGAVSSACTMMGVDGTITATSLVNVVLPVDVAVSPDGSYAAVVGAGDSFGSDLTSLDLVPLQPGTTLDESAFDAGVPVASSGASGPSGSPVLEEDAGVAASQEFEVGLRLNSTGQAVAVAFDGVGHVLVQTREPANLWVVSIPVGGLTTPNWIAPDVPITLSTLSRDDTGHDVFHAAAGAMIACASCHPEGGDDGHVWLLDNDRRRTPSLRGTIAGTAPYHWAGDQPDFPTLTNNVYTLRMSGQQLNQDQIGVLQTWVESIPAPAVASWIDTASAARGQALFNASGCPTCHSGAKFTNNETVDVGTGGAFQVPPLVGVGWRTPLLHDGCAVTIADRFSTCGTAGHGNTSSLTAQNITDLSTYLESL